MARMQSETFLLAKIRAQGHRSMSEILFDLSCSIGDKKMTVCTSTVRLPQGGLKWIARLAKFRFGNCFRVVVS